MRCTKRSIGHRYRFGVMRRQRVRDIRKALSAHDAAKLHPFPTFHRQKLGSSREGVFPLLHAEGQAGEVVDAWRIHDLRRV